MGSTISEQLWLSAILSHVFRVLETTIAPVMLAIQV